MVNLLETLYLLTALSGVMTLVLWSRERRSARPAAVHLAAKHWAVLTAALAGICLGLYLYLASR